MYEDLARWCEEGTLYIRCLEDIEDSGVAVCSEDEIYLVWDVIKINSGEIFLTVDTNIEGVTWCVSMDDDNFEIAYVENDT